MVSCLYFTTNFIHVTKTVQKENQYDSFIIYLCVDGEAIINFEGFSETIKKGETILIPSVLKQFNIEANNAKLLEVYV
jgi:mannose-6-phosphate isomerase